MPDPDPGRAPPVLVPVPLHRWRLWGQGFNQAALLAQELARYGRGEADVAALVRHKRTPHLGGLGRAAREQVLKGAIMLAPKHLETLAGRDFVLVDDVLTSGATSRACIEAIGSAKPASMAIACFAQVDAEHHLTQP